jgi:hypothetical protein
MYWYFAMRSRILQRRTSLSRSALKVGPTMAVVLPNGGSIARFGEADATLGLRCKASQNKDPR